MPRTLFRKTNVKIALLLAIVAVSMVVMGVLLSGMQESLSRSSYNTEMEEEASELKELLASAEEEASQNKETFDAIYQSKAMSVAFMAANDAGFEATDAKMAEYRQLLDVDNVLVVKSDGTIVAKAAETKANFSYARFNYLRECLATGEPSRAVEIELPGEDWLCRYYAARLDADTMVVIEQNPEELRLLDAETSSTESVLRNISVGQNGYVFALSAQTYLIEYHPDADLVGRDALDAGIDVAKLEDGAVAQLTLDGEELYCRVSLIGDTYHVCAVPESDMAASRMVTVAVILFVFFAVIATVTLYGIFVMRQEERDGHANDHLVRVGRLRYNREVGKRAAIFTLVGFIAIVAVSFYMQTLFALSTQSVVNKERASSIAETIDRVNDRADELTVQYDERYLSKARVAAYILEANPALATKPKMQELADVLQVSGVYLFDGSGSMMVSNAPYEHFSLSTDETDQSFAFWQLLQGVDSYVQEPTEDEMTGELVQYIGVATYDDAGYTNGFVQVMVHAGRLEELLRSVQIDHVLDGVKAGSGGFAFAVSKADGTISYYPDASIQGKQATEVGLKESQIRGGYDDYITIGGETFYASSVETPDYFVYVAGPEGELMAQRLPLTLATGLIALACLAVVFCLIAFEPEHMPAPLRSMTEDPSADRVFEIETPSGRRTRTESAASRWLNRSLDWSHMTPEQKLGYVLRLFVGVGVVAVFFSVLFKDQIFGTNSVFGYILGGGWERGLNIFALTASVMTACVIFTLSWVVQKVLHLLSDALSARGETVCRLLVSLTKYGAILGTLYWCLATVGVDTGTLLASAGLLTLAISFGAKDLVTDLLSGLFIIFEGEFRVGDTISVGTNTGTVMEIGIRTTKINDGNDNVIVLRNSAISNVVNRTKLDSFATIDVEVSVGEDLPHLENVLKEALPRIAERQPMILDGPFYRGIVALSTSTMTIRVIARCSEKNRSALERNLKREMRLLLTRHDIAPYQLQFEHDEDDRSSLSKGEADELEGADSFVESQDASIGKYDEKRAKKDKDPDARPEA